MTDDSNNKAAPAKQRREAAPENGPGDKDRQAQPGRGGAPRQSYARQGRPREGQGREGRDTPRQSQGREGQGREGRDTPRQSQAQGRRDGKPGTHLKGPAADLIELDRELMKLLARRSSLVSRMRGGRDHAATPSAIQAEKAVRIAWEAGAPAFSKDPRFSRQLFSLLQDIKVMSKEQAKNAASFRLSPPSREISGNIAGPTLARSAQMRLILAAALGRPLTLENVSLTTALLDTVNLCAQAGARVRHEMTGAGLGRVCLEGGAPLVLQDKTLYAGEDAFGLYLAAFAAAGRPGACRFTGGSRLKGADLAALRQTLPLFGARLAHVVPRSQGLPANLESSGDIPPLVVVPAELPFEGLCALLLAPLFWNLPLTLNLAHVPAAAATAALALVRPLQREAGAEVETHGPHIAFTPSALELPEQPALPLDPALCAYLLAMPAFCGGGLTLRGLWPAQMPEARQASALLAWAGLALADTGSSVGVRALGEPFTMPLQVEELTPALGPLFLVLAALNRSLHPEALLPAPLPYPQDEQDMSLAAELLGLLGLTLDEQRLAPLENEEEARPWAGPDACWSMALTLAAFLKPGRQLTNPASITEAMPAFWSVYNSLPQPLDPALPQAKTSTEESADDRPARRRIIAE